MKVEECKKYSIQIEPENLESTRNALSQWGGIEAGLSAYLSGEYVAGLLTGNKVEANQIVVSASEGGYFDLDITQSGQIVLEAEGSTWLLSLNGQPILTLTNQQSDLDDATNCAALISFEQNDFRGLEKLNRIQKLSIFNPFLVRLPSEIAGLKQLTDLDLQGCNWLTDLSAVRNLNSLETLNLQDCKSIDTLEPIAGLLELKDLRLSFAEYTLDLPGLPNLRKLTVENCELLRNLSPFYKLQSLQSLFLYGCESLQDVLHLHRLKKLNRLELTGCYELKDISALSELRNMEFLRLANCENVTDLSSISELVNLKELYLGNFRCFEDLSALSLLHNLEILKLNSCEQLNSLSGIENLGNLKRLFLFHCSSLENISSISGLSGLIFVFLTGCLGPGWTERCCRRIHRRLGHRCRASARSGKGFRRRLALVACRDAVLPSRKTRDHGIERCAERADDHAQRLSPGVVAAEPPHARTEPKLLR